MIAEATLSGLMNTARNSDLQEVISTYRMININAYEPEYVSVGHDEYQNNAPYEYEYDIKNLEGADNGYQTIDNYIGELKE